MKKGGTPHLHELTAGFSLPARQLDALPNAAVSVRDSLVVSQPHTPALAIVPPRFSATPPTLRRVVPLLHLECTSRRWILCSLFTVHKIHL